MWPTSNTYPMHQVQQGKVSWNMNNFFKSIGGLFKLSSKVKNKFDKYDCIHPKFLKRFMVRFFY